MTLTLRSASTTTATTKAAVLTHAEMDANWLHALQSANHEFAQSGSAEQLTLQENGRLYVNVAQFMTAAQRADAQLASPTLDHASAFTAIIAQYMGVQGTIKTRGVDVFVPAGYRIRLATDPFGVLPHDNAATPTQVPLRIFGAGMDTHTTGTISLKTSSVIDFRYTTSNNAKIDTRGRGVLELDHLVIADESGNAEAFVHTTNTCVLIHDNCFLGSKTSSWDQDCIILGGTSTTIDGTSDAPFQGYGSQIYNNHFHRIRRAVVGRVFANGVPVHHNTVWADCGLTTGAPFEYDGDPLGSTQSNTGLPVHHNLVELVNYKYGLKARMCVASTIGPNDFYDTGASATAIYTFGDGAQFNQVIGGYHPDDVTFVEETGTAANTNSWATSHQNQDTVYSTSAPVRFKGSLTKEDVSSTTVTALIGENSEGDQFDIQYQNVGGAGNHQVLIRNTPAGGSLQTLLTIRDRLSGVVSLIPPHHIEFAEVTDPPAPAADQARFYLRDDASGNTQLVVRFASPHSTPQVLATAGAGLNYLVATTTLSALSGASVTATNLIPATAFVLGVTTRVTAAIGTSNGTTGYQVGDGSDVDRWGDKTGTASGTTTTSTAATADPTGFFLALSSVVITAKTGNFDGTGDIRITVAYMTMNAPAA